MNDKLYSVSCDPMCGFMVKSHDKKEVGDLAFEHVSNKHADKGYTREQVVGTMKTE